MKGARMSNSRRDNKGRVLREGEVQRSDGRYMYRYTDIHGERRTIYANRLVATDRIANGVRDTIPLREKIATIQQDLRDGVDTDLAQTATLDDYFALFMNAKRGLKETTLARYRSMYETYFRERLGDTRVSAIRYTTIKQIYIDLLVDTKLKSSTVEAMNILLHAILEVARKDGAIRSNPTDGIMREVKQNAARLPEKRHALTIPQQKRFVDFLNGTRHFERWVTLFTLMLGTGMRVGEATSLRWDDCDFKKNEISVNHTATYSASGSGGVFHITTPKTVSGMRTIPMLKQVRDVLLKEKAWQEEVGINSCEIDGYTNFIFTGQRTELPSTGSVNAVLRQIVYAANREEQMVAAQEDREPVLLPHISSHILRHTFCTRYCENENNIKAIQQIMGHRSAVVTMDIYNEATKEKLTESMALLEDKMIL